MDYNFPIPEYEENHTDTNNEISSNLDKKVNQKMIFQNQSYSISDKIEQYLNSYSESTKIAYASDLKDFWNFSGKTLQETTENDILKYIKDLENRGYANSSINRKLASLSKIMKIYVAMKLMPYNPISNLSALGKLYKPVDNSIQLSITLHDVEAVVANSNKRTSTLVRFLTNAGVRISEALSITKSDIEPYNQDYMRIKILGKGGKIRFIFLSYQQYQEIKDVYDGDSIYLFASKTQNQLSRVNIYKQIKRAFLNHTGKSCSPHQLRHFFATQKIVNEKKDYKSVSKYLGHVSPVVTMSYYVSSQLNPEDTAII